MKCHPLQVHNESIDRLSEIFRVAMEKNGVLPKDPWRATRLEAWLAGMGAKFRPGDAHYRSLKPLDTQNFVNFRVTCPKFSVKKGRWLPRLRGDRATRFVHIEIPWALADKILMMGFLP